MADADEEIEDADLDKEDHSDDEEKDDAEDSDADDDKGSKKDKDSDEDEDSEDDDSDNEDDSDDEDSKPLTRGDLKKILSERSKERTKNRDAAAERLSKKRGLSNSTRSADRKEAERLDRIENFQRKQEVLESKRQFGYENNLAPDEVDVVFRLTKRPTGKSLNDPVIKGALTGYREAKRARANIPGSGGAGRPGRADRNKEDKNLSPTERKDRFVARRQEILSARGR